MQISTALKWGGGITAIGGAAAGVAALSQVGKGGNGTLAQGADVILGSGALAAGGLGALATYSGMKYGKRLDHVVKTNKQFINDVKLATNPNGTVDQAKAAEAVKRASVPIK